MHVLFCYKSCGWAAKRKAVLFCLLQFWREGETAPSQKTMGRAEELLQRAVWGILFSLTRPHKHGAELMGNSWAWHWAMTSPHGPCRGSPGSQWEWCRAWSWAGHTENGWTERRIESSLACEHTAARKVQWGRSGGDWVFFCSKICVLSVLSSLDSHLCRSSPLWHAWAAPIKEKVWEDHLKALASLRPSCTQNATSLAAAGFLWPHLPVLYTVKT